MNYLRRIDDPAGDRVITFNQEDIARSEYIRMSGIDYQEMQYCHSPVISLQQDLNAAVDSSNPLTTARLRKVALERRRQGLAPTVQAPGIDTSEISDDEFELEDQLNKRMFAKINVTTPAPAVMITAVEKSQDPKPYDSEDIPSPLPISTMDASGATLSEQFSTPLTQFSSGDALLPVLVPPVSKRLSSSPPPKQPLSMEEEAILMPSKESDKNVSALSALIEQKKAKADNPFAADHGFFSGKGDSNALNLKMYLSFSKQSSPMQLVIKRDVTVQEAIGYALYVYVDEKMQPPLDANKSTVAHWNLRMVEDDGEIDEDFPPLERTRKVSGYGYDEFGIVEATATQVKANQALAARQRKPTPATAPLNSVATLAAPQTAINYASLASASISSPITASATRASAMGPSGSQIFLRIRVNPSDQVMYTTLINVTTDMYIADVLDLICRRRNLDSKDWVLTIPDKNNIFVPLDRTVESLEGVQELSLVKRALVFNSPIGTPAAQAALMNSTSSPNAGLFTHQKRRSEVAQPKYVSSNDFISSYRKYTVNRKMPISVGKHERVLAIDGDYIQILPSESKAFENAKTSSFRVTSIADIKQSSRAPHNFKIFVDRGREVKRYDFEAQSDKEATEIVQKINDLRAVYRANDRLANVNAPMPHSSTSTPVRRRLAVL